MSKISVEYAHIYTNQHISDEHKLSLTVLAKVKESIESEGKQMSLVAMVDDYSFPDPSFDYDAFVAWLGENNSKPDLVIRESQLIPLCDQVLRMVEDVKMELQLTDYIKAKKYPCSLFIATWYMLRLGKLSSPIFPEGEAADELINILPESFKPFEDMGLEIIGKTPFRAVLPRIQYRFLPGRLLA